MSKKRYDVCTGRDYERNGEKKTSWKQVGTALVNDNGSITLYIEAIPLAWFSMTEAKLTLFEPREDGGKRGGGSGSSGPTPF